MHFSTNDALAFFRKTICCLIDQVVDKTAEPSYLLVNPQVNNFLPPVPSCYSPEGMFRSPVPASQLFFSGDLPWVQHELVQDCNITKHDHSELSSLFTPPKDHLIELNLDLQHPFPQAGGLCWHCYAFSAWKEQRSLQASL